MDDVIMKLTAPMRIDTVFENMGFSLWEKFLMISIYPAVIVMWYFWYMWQPRESLGDEAPVKGNSDKKRLYNDSIS